MACHTLKKTILSLPLALCWLSAVHGVAQDDTGGSLAPIEQAFAEAEAKPDLKVSFTMTFSAPGNEPVVKRFDAAADQWRLLQGDPETLDDTARTKLDNISRSESEPGGLLYADYPPHLDDITLQDETAETWIYTFTYSRAAERVDNPEDKPVETQLVVNKESSVMSLYAVRSLKPFKPHPAAKLDTLVMQHEFEKALPDAPPLMVRMYQKVNGERLFRTVDEEFTATFTDFEIVD